jgi:formate C-acetyltransferase
MPVVFSEEKTALLDRLRAEARTCQNELTEFPFAYPVAVANAWRQCPQDASLEMQWAWRCGAILDAMNFASERGETLIGRLLPPSGTPEEIEAAWAFLDTPSVKERRTTPGQTGHCEPYYQEAFQIGLDGLLDTVRKLAAAAPSGQQQECYRSFAYVLEAFSRMIERAADQAVSPEVAQRCRAIAHRPPQSFREALQLIWFIDLGITMGDHAVLVGPGRLDRLLGAFYAADVAAGRLTYEDAVFDLAQFYLYINKISWASLAYGAMVDGGTVNPLSYAALEAVRHSRLVYPSVGLCVTATTPHDLKRLAVDIIAEGYPNPAFFNDGVIRRGLESYGVPPEASAEYINSTCVEITPCGASNVWVASPYFNLNALLLETMAQAEESQGYAAFEEAFFAHVSQQVAQDVARQNGFRQCRHDTQRRPLQSVFTNDCLARGLDIELGGARYNWVTCSFVGLANCADGLNAIHQEVFEEHSLTLKEFLAILQDNFAGHEAFRQKLLHVLPKYGVDNAVADATVGRIITFIQQECARHRMLPDNSPFIPGTFCWIQHQRLGACTGATPDGRQAGFPFADGAGPAQGRETQGPTAAVRSVCSWNHAPMIGGTAFNMKFPKTILADDASREKLISLMDVFMAGGGFEMQINTTDNALLKKAIEHPEDYRDLIVRIGGYTDYFTKLSPQMQQELMMRTQYAEV